MSGKRFEAIAPYDATFYASLARMVAEEPVKTRDITMMGELHSLGIGKGLTFRPDARTFEIFERAIAEAHAYMVEGWRHAGFEWWPKRKWRSPVGEDVIKSGGNVHLQRAGARGRARVQLLRRVRHEPQPAAKSLRDDVRGQQGRAAQRFEHLSPSDSGGCPDEAVLVGRRI